MDDENIISETEVYIRDRFDRIICKIIKDRVMVMRLPDMDDFTKNALIDLYSEFTCENIEDLKKFLNFEGEDNEFCS